MGACRDSSRTAPGSGILHENPSEKGTNVIIHYTPPSDCVCNQDRKWERARVCEGESERIRQKLWC